MIVKWNFFSIKNFKQQQNMKKLKYLIQFFITSRAVNQIFGLITKLCTGILMTSVIRGHFLIWCLEDALKVASWKFLELPAKPENLPEHESYTIWMGFRLKGETRHSKNHSSKNWTENIIMSSLKMIGSLLGHRYFNIFGPVYELLIFACAWTFS